MERQIFALKKLEEQLGKPPRVKKPKEKRPCLYAISSINGVFCQGQPETLVCGETFSGQDFGSDNFVGHLDV